MPGSQNTITLPKGPIPPSYWTDDRGHILITVGIVFMVIEIVAFGLRMFACRLRRAKFSWDDVLVISALLSNLAMVAMMIASVYLAGIGQHTLAAFMHAKDMKFLGQIGLIIVPVLYAAANTTSKAIILRLFLRIFTTPGLTRWTTYLVLAVITLHATVATFLLIFQCSPIAATWDTLVRGKCLDTAALFKWSCLPNVITDLVMLVLPMPKIWTLKASWRMKFGITLMLLLATIGIVASTIRAVEFFHDSDKMFGDPAWYMLDLMTYTIAEPGTLFLAACFSTYKPLGRFFTGQKMRSLLSRFRVVSPRYATRLESPDFRPDDSKERKQGAGKPVRGFDSFILSEIEREESTHGSARSERVV
ncbi:hypothetical protein BU26DRAFT_570585 [Trematosphaeria pertusa]|uniref:Rhodopsin domain-containing protein n=1 Tax=Trematosphaeria pertusa TaxID=390896 RepID=A0A6A6HWV6_9PLEO|nr:uncharacterized protein BU26DRAFT_570585 [Trematosphaeria pertusa]KAF2242501.1 hypothetical protein BU26DRAFT_570585 [Trematosphaeria pertusa]